MNEWTNEHVSALCTVTWAPAKHHLILCCRWCKMEKWLGHYSQIKVWDMSCASHTLFTGSCESLDKLWHISESWHFSFHTRRSSWLSFWIPRQVWSICSYEIMLWSPQNMGGWLSLIACLQRLMEGWCRLRDRADDQCMSPSGMLDAAHVIKSSQLISVILGRENVHGN